MLKHLQSHQEYLNTQSQLRGTVPLEALVEYGELIATFQLLNFDHAHDYLKTLYSTTGRPALRQIEIFRSMVLCAYLNRSWEQMIHLLHHRAVFRMMIGLRKEEIPTLPSFYAFYARLMPTNETSITRKPNGKKPTKKLKKNEKMPEKKEGRVQKMVTLVTKDKPFNESRPERHLQTLFQLISVDTSMKQGLLSDSCYLSGDGTSVRTGATSYGRKICDCRKQGLFKCDCPRHYSDPKAEYGWDSYKAQYYYGHTAYFLSTYNQELKIDLPLYVKMVSAKRHDSVTAILSLGEFRELYPNLTIKGFLSDSASDNYPTYQLLARPDWNIPAFIALNNRKEAKFTYKQVEINDQGVPICEGGLPMIYHGRDDSRCRNKFRCPAMAKKGVVCPLEKYCSSSPYGRTVYTKTEDNPRFFTVVPRNTKQWQLVMNQRTSIERINKQVLRDCGIENNGVRTRGRINLWITMAMMVIHLKAQYKYRIHEQKEGK